MRLLKMISIISYLLIGGIQQNGLQNFGVIFLFGYEFFHDIFMYPFTQNPIFWEGSITILVLLCLIGIRISKKHRDRHLLILYFIILIIAGLFFTGINNSVNLHRISNLGFIIPSIIFLISTIALIILNFSNRIK